MGELAVAERPEVSRELSVPPAPARPPRNLMLDACRGLGSLAVIWVHTIIDSPKLAKTAALARYGTAFFAIVAIFFLLHGISSKPDEGFWAYAKLRFRRLYLPFLVWSVIYLLLRTVNRAFVVQKEPVHLNIQRLFMGTARHLWFLPFILLAGLACYHLRAVLKRLHYGRIAIAIAAFAAGFIIANIRSRNFPRIEHYTGKFIHNAWMFLPGVMWGIALASIYPLLPRKFTKTPAIAFVGLFLLLGSLIWLWFVSELPFIDTRSVPSLPRNISGLGLLLIALYPWNSPILVPIAAFGRTTYGIYLVHLIFVDSFELLMKRTHLGRQWWLEIASYVVSVILSLLLVRLMRAWKGTAWLIP